MNAYILLFSLVSAFLVLMGGFEMIYWIGGACLIAVRKSKEQKPCGILYKNKDADEE